MFRKIGYLHELNEIFMNKVGLNCDGWIGLAFTEVTMNRKALDHAKVI